jgi:NTE family protein
MSANRRMPTGLYSVGRPADVDGAMDRLRAHWLVLAVPEVEREELVQAFDVYAMPAQWSVFRKGEPAGGLFVVLSGRLRAHLDHGGHVDMGAGEVIGEVSLFLDAPRAADVTTVRDTLLAYLTHDVLTGFASRFPDLWRELGALASRRLTHSAEPSPPGVLTVVALDDDPSGAWFAAQVAEALAPYGPATVLSDVDPDAVRDRSVVAWVADVEAETTTLVLAAGPAHTSWHDLCLRQADPACSWWPTPTGRPSSAWPRSSRWSRTASAPKPTCTSC